MGYGPCYNVCNGGFARILCCSIKINPMSVNLIKKREYDERVQAILTLLNNAYDLSKTMSQDVGRDSVGYNRFANNIFSLYYCMKRMEFLLNTTNRYEKK